jgi:hypothetical protein
MKPNSKHSYLVSMLLTIASCAMRGTGVQAAPGDAPWPASAKIDLG